MTGLFSDQIQSTLRQCNIFQISKSEHLLVRWKAHFKQVDNVLPSSYPPQWSCFNKKQPYVNATIQSGLILVPWYQPWRRWREEGQRERETDKYRPQEACLCLALITNLLCWGNRQPRQGIIVFFISVQSLQGKIKCFHFSLCKSFILHLFWLFRT